MSLRDERGGNGQVALFNRWLSQKSRVAVIICATALALPIAPLRAQASAMNPAPRMGMRWPTLWLGGGLASGNDDMGSASLATKRGAVMLAAVELPVSRGSGPSRFALRAEGAWSQQSLATTADGALSGDVQTMSAGLAFRVSPFATRTASSASAEARFSPYVLAGMGLARMSTRVQLSVIDPDVPTALFGQTSSELAATALGGLGTQIRIARMQLFVEARSAWARRDAGTLRTTVVLLGMTLIPHR